MSAQDLLNTDLTTVGRWIGLAWRWWLDELADLTPRAWRGASGRGAPWTAEMASDTGPIRLRPAGSAAPASTVADGRSRTVDLLAPPGAVLVQELDLPRLAPADLNRLLGLNIDRYTPFRAEQVYFDAAVLDKDLDGQKQRVRLGIMTRARADAVLDRARSQGLTVARMGIDLEDDRQRLDFMRAIRAGAGGGVSRRTWLWGLCAALLVVNLAIAVIRDMQDVGRLERLADRRRPQVTAAAKLRRTVEAERTRRTALLQRRAQHEPLRILDAASRALPAGQWVQRLEWNGRTVRLAGYRRPDFDVAGALRSPALRNPRSLPSESQQKTADGHVAFDVTADAATGTVR